MTPEDAETPEELEEELAMLLLLMGIPAEEHLYDLMSKMSTLIADLSVVTTKTEFDTWYSSTKTAGFTKEMITNTLVHVIKAYVSAQVDYFDIDYLYDEIAALEAEIDQNQVLLANIRTDVEAYGNVNTEVANDSLALFDYLVNDFTSWQGYVGNVNTYWDSHNWEGPVDDYYDLECHLQQSYFERYVNKDSEYANYLDSEYDLIWNSLDQGTKDEFTPLLNYARSILEHKYTVTKPLQDSLYDHFDTGYGDHTESVAQRIRYEFFGDYEFLFYEIQSRQDDLFLINEDINRNIENYQTLLILDGYFDSQEGNDKLVLLVNSLYDLVDHLASNVDEDLFDLVMQVMTDETFDPSTLMTSDQIVLYLGKVVTMLQSAQTEFMGNGIDHLAAFITDIATLFIENDSEMDQSEKDFIIPLIETKVDNYLTMANDTLTNVLTFLASIDEVKATAIINAIDYFTPDEEEYDMMMVEEQGFDLPMIVYVADLVNTLIGDGSLNLGSILEDIITVYFDVEYALNPDSTVVASVNDAAQANLEGLMALLPDIAVIDPMSMSADDFASLNEFMDRMAAFQSMFEVGFESILDYTSFGYEHQDFLDLVYDMGDWEMSETEAEQMIDDLMGILNMTVEEDAYYLIQAVVLHVGGLYSVESFTDLKAWVLGFEGFGLTHQEMAVSIFNIIMYQLSMTLAIDGEFDQQVQYYENNILTIGALITEHEGSLIDLDVEVEAKLREYIIDDEPTITEYLAYWAALKEDAIKLGNLNMLMNEYDNNKPHFDYYTAEQLMNLKWTIYSNPDNPQYQTDYDDLWASLTPEEQSAYADFIVEVNDYINWFDVTIDPYYTSLDPLHGFDEELVNYIHEDALWEHNNIQFNIYMLEGQILQEEDEIARIERERVRTQAIYDYLDLHHEDVKVLLWAGIDEIVNVFNVADPVTFDPLFAVFFNSSPVYDVMGLPGALPEDIFADMTPAEIIVHLHNIADVLDTLFSTVDDDEDDKLIGFALDMLRLQMIAEGTPETEIDLLIGTITPLIETWYPHVEEVLGIVANALYSLDETDMADIMNFIPKPETEPSVMQILKLVTTVSDILTFGDPAGLDYTTLINYAVELYLTVAYEGDYPGTETELAEIQDAVVAHVNDMLDNLHNINLIDMAEMELLDYQLIYQAIEHVEWLFEQLGDIESIIYPAPVAFGYTHEDFVDLVTELEGLTDPTEIEDRISEYIAVFEATDEEYAFYMLFFIGPMVDDIQDIYSFHDFVDFYARVRSLGFPKLDLATLIVNALAAEITATASDMQAQIDQYASDIVGYQADLVDYNTAINNIKSLTQDEIDNLLNSYPDYHDDAQSAYDLIAEIMIAEDIYDFELGILLQADDDGYAYTTEFDLYLNNYGGDDVEEPLYSSFSELVFEAGWTTEQVEMYQWVFESYKSWMSHLRSFRGYCTTLNLDGVTMSDGTTLFGDYLEGQKLAIEGITENRNSTNALIEDALIEKEYLEDNYLLYATLSYFFADPDMSSLCPEYTDKSNTELTKMVVVLLMERFDNQLSLWTEDDIYELDILFYGYYLDFDETTSPDQIVEEIKVAMELFGPLLEGASPNSITDKMLNVLLNRLILAYANSVELESGETVEDVRADVAGALFDIIDIAYQISAMDPVNLEQADLDIINSLFPAITTLEDALS